MKRGVVRPDGKTDKGYASVSQLKSVVEDDWFFKQRDAAFALRGAYNALSDDVTRDSLSDEIVRNWDDTRALGRLVSGLQRDAGMWDAADSGTRIHKYTELYDRREMAIWDMPADVKPVLYNYAALTAGIRWTHIEQQVINDELKYVGTLDRIGEINGESYVIDIKAGLSAPMGLRSTTFQCEAYARAQLYNGDETRTESPANTRTGFMVWVPYDPNVSEGKVFQLEYGTGETIITAAHAWRARKASKINPDNAPLMGVVPWDVATAIENAKNAEELYDVYAIASKRGQWTALLQAEAKARKIELSKDFK